VYMCMCMCMCTCMCMCECHAAVNTRVSPFIQRAVDNYKHANQWVEYWTVQ